MEVWIATGNQGKLREFRALLSDIFSAVHAQSELNFYSAPPENGTTFEENARIKARSLHKSKSDVWVLADDSGLEVEGLNNLPGIHSARYAGDKAADAENTAKLLKMVHLKTPMNRAAKFRCVLVAYSPTGEEYVFTGELKGTITKSQKGSGGFGYDPVFVPDGQIETLAELNPGLKNKLSHRAQALKAFKTVLRSMSAAGQST